MSGMGEISLDQLCDSAILYHRRPPRFMTIFVATVAVIVAVTLIWGSVAIKAEEAKSQGIVVSPGISVVSPGTDGVVSEILHREGDLVSEGEAIISFDKTDLRLSMERLEAEKNRISGRIGNIDRLVSESYKCGPIQPFSDSGDQREFYALAAKHLAEIEAIRESGAEPTAIDASIASLGHQLRSTLLAERSSLSASLASTEADARACESLLNRCDVRANGPGILHFDEDVRKGATVRAGTILGSVSPQGESRHVEMHVPSWVRAKIAVGQECRFTVDGLPQVEYGVVTGKIASISENATIQQGGAYFRVVAEYGQDCVRDSRGGQVAISDGMTVSVWVTYEKTTYLKHWMEQIGLGDLF